MAIGITRMVSQKRKDHWCTAGCTADRPGTLHGDRAGLACRTSEGCDCGRGARAENKLVGKPSGARVHISSEVSCPVPRLW